MCRWTWRSTAAWCTASSTWGGPFPKRCHGPCRCGAGAAPSVPDPLIRPFELYTPPLHHATLRISVSSTPCACAGPRWTCRHIVFNAHYLMYFDTAIADYWRAIGLPYEAAMEQLEGDLYVKKAAVEFHASARADDQIDVAMRCARIGNSSMQFVCAIFRGDQLLITGELIYVFADPRTQTSRPVPPVLRGILDDYEAGRPVVELLQGEWASFGRGCRAGAHGGVHPGAGDSDGDGVGRGRCHRLACRGAQPPGPAAGHRAPADRGPGRRAASAAWPSFVSCAARSWAPMC
jgi:YbgC/YbaW family acyl-CoA thioester hydrolase